jgi:hypothetical protein
MSVTIRVLGESMAPLERIPRVGDLLGISPATAFRWADDWPTTGKRRRRRVCVIPLLDQLGIPYEVVDQEEEEHDGDC